MQNHFITTRVLCCLVLMGMGLGLGAVVNLETLAQGLEKPTFSNFAVLRLLNLAHRKNHDV